MYGLRLTSFITRLKSEQQVHTPRAKTIHMPLYIGTESRRTTLLGREDRFSTTMPTARVARVVTGAVWSFNVLGELSAREVDNSAPKKVLIIIGWFDCDHQYMFVDSELRR